MSRKISTPSLLILVCLSLASACQSGIPGVDSPLKVENGTIQVTKVERIDNIVAPNGLTARPQPGLEFMLVTLKTTGEASNFGFYVIDSKGQKYQCGALYQGSGICQIPLNSKGLILWYSNDAQIPLYSFLGEAPSSNDTGVLSTDVAPASDQSGAEKPGPTDEYVVKAGDTCDSIAYSHNTTRTNLIELNHLPPNCGDIQIGQKLIIPTPSP